VGLQTSESLWESTVWVEGWNQPLAERLFAVADDGGKFGKLVQLIWLEEWLDLLLIRVGLPVCGEPSSFFDNLSFADIFSRR
jgi:hypothetical protein